jgi:hypothetical protein
MKNSFRFHFVTAFVTLISLFAIPAFAAREISPLVIQRQEDAAEVASSSIRVQGTLTCSMGDSNTGQPCSLRIKDQLSGKTYNLSNENVAMRLYHSGTKNVAILGSYQDAETIRIAKIEPN